MVRLREKYRAPTWQEEELHPVVGDIDELAFLITTTYDGTSSISLTLTTWSMLDDSSQDWGCFQFCHSLYHVGGGKGPDIRVCLPNKVIRCESRVIKIFKNLFGYIVSEDGQGTSFG